jgi:RNA polymerase sigma-70 factor (ECF subfamily)
VFEEELGYVWSTLRRLGVRSVDLEDVAHEVFVVVHRRFADFDEARPIRPWLFGIAYRVTSDYRRRAHRRHETLTSDEPEGLGGGPEEEASVRERRALLLRALDRLDAEKRAVIVMHDLDEIAMPDVALALEIPLNTGYSRLRLARRELADAVRELRGRSDE